MQNAFNLEYAETKENLPVEYHDLHEAVVAEWLRRLTRNQIPSGSVGSNPTDCESLIFFCWVLLTLPLVNLGKAFVSNKHRWFSGRMAACHAVGPGSIPGRCIQLFFVCLFGWFCFLLTSIFSAKEWRGKRK